MPSYGHMVMSWSVSSGGGGDEVGGLVGIGRTGGLAVDAENVRRGKTLAAATELEQCVDHTVPGVEAPAGPR